MLTNIILRCLTTIITEIIHAITCNHAIILNLKNLVNHKCFKEF